MSADDPLVAPALLTEVRAALAGAWWLDRRASVGDPRFLRLVLYRDGRFGSLAVDGRTVVYGDWRLVPLAVADADTLAVAACGRLTLRFDHQPDPSATWHAALRHGPLGPLVLSDVAGRQRLVLCRAEPIEGVLVGAWRVAGAAARGTDAATATAMPALDELELRSDAMYTLRHADGTQRAGRWGFLRDPSSNGGGLRGELHLDPADPDVPTARWPAMLERRPHPVFTLTTDDACTRLELCRPLIDPATRALVATWHLAEPAPVPAARELVLRANGAAEVLTRPGAARLPGRWTFARRGVRGDALEGTLTLTVLPLGHAARREEQRIVLPFTRLGELHVQVPASADPVRYRRLFR